MTITLPTLNATHLSALKSALGRDSTTHDQQCFARLMLYMNRQPTASEIANMATDANLNLWVLTGQ